MGRKKKFKCSNKFSGYSGRNTTYANRNLMESFEIIEHNRFLYSVHISQQYFQRRAKEVTFPILWSIYSIGEDGKIKND